MCESCEHDRKAERAMCRDLVIMAQEVQDARETGNSRAAAARKADLMAYVVNQTADRNCEVGKLFLTLAETMAASGTLMVQVNSNRELALDMIRTSAEAVDAAHVNAEDIAARLAAHSERLTDTYGKDFSDA